MSSVSERLSPVGGTAAGVTAWVVGYLCTYLVVGSDVRQSGLRQLVRAFGEDPATAKLVGWVFYSAHFVETVVRGVPLFGGSVSFVGGDGFTPLLYLVPVGLLVAAGVALARWHGASDLTAGALAGASTVPGYLLASVAGAVLFQVSVAGVSGRPHLPTAVLLAGVVYPLVFATAGGAIAASRRPSAAGTETSA